MFDDNNAAQPYAATTDNNNAATNYGTDSYQQPLPNESEELIPASFPNETTQVNDNQPSSPRADDQSYTQPADPVAQSDSGSQAPADNDADGLLSIKNQALQQLSPLVDNLDQSPEDKFRTTMMMIQASDNQTLLKTAFEAAQQIKDDKERAQALLDVVNEINYFTQQ